MERQQLEVFGYNLWVWWKYSMIAMGCYSSAIFLYVNITGKDYRIESGNPGYSQSLLDQAFSDEGDPQNWQQKSSKKRR